MPMPWQYGSNEPIPGPEVHPLAHPPFHCNPGGRVLLIAIRQDPHPPMRFCDLPLRRMRVVREPRRPGFDSPPGRGPAASLAHIIPPEWGGSPEGRRPAAQARRVQGEILSDSRGQLYEKSGFGIRPLGRLFSGSGGEIFEEIVPTALELDGRDRKSEAPRGDSEPMDFAPGDAGRAASHPSRRDPSRKPAAFNALFPEPGVLRQVSWLRFRTLLEPQMAHPEKLREEHRLACHVQVYEAGRRITTGQLVRWVAGDALNGEQFHPLTDAAAAALGLPRKAGRRSDAARKNAPEEILPGERVFRLALARDPTAFAYAGGDGEAPEPGGGGTDDRGPLEGGPRRRIPEKYLSPWEFRLSREEAVYDLNQEARHRRSPLAWVARRIRWLLGGRRALRKWMALVSGKPPEEQLWSVRPPEGSLSHPAVRAWAAQTLSAAGYDSGCMLLEWEVFWRRKGI